LDQPDRFSDLLEDIAGSVALIDGRPAGGALLAPRLVLLPAMEACADGQLVRLGTAVELLHRAALVHRQPQVEERRAVSGDTPISRTLQGDILLSQCYRLLAEHGAARTGAILSRAMAEVAEGELTGHAEGAPPSAERVQRTAALYEGAAATGALVADLPRAESAEYALWGRAVGVAHERSLSFGEAEGFCPPPASFAAEAHRVYAGVGKLDCLPQAA
jgi:geranylgeranyl pyrophosphate synthase